MNLTQLGFTCQIFYDRDEVVGDFDNIKLEDWTKCSADIRTRLRYTICSTRSAESEEWVEIDRSWAMVVGEEYFELNDSIVNDINSLLMLYATINNTDNALQPFPYEYQMDN
jgi:hypothetical protein